MKVCVRVKGSIRFLANRWIDWLDFMWRNKMCIPMCCVGGSGNVAGWMTRENVQSKCGRVIINVERESSNAAHLKTNATKK